MGVNLEGVELARAGYQLVCSFRLRFRLPICSQVLLLLTSDTNTHSQHTVDTERYKAMKSFQRDSIIPSVVL